MTRRDFRFEDELPVFLSLATAVTILVMVVGGIWIWSSILERAGEVTVERDVGLP